MRDDHVARRNESLIELDRWILRDGDGGEKSQMGDHILDVQRLMLDAGVGRDGSHSEEGKPCREET